MQFPKYLYTSLAIYYVFSDQELLHTVLLHQILLTNFLLEIAGLCIARNKDCVYTATVPIFADNQTKIINNMQ